MTSSVSTQYMSSLLLQSITQTQSTLATKSVEESSGQYADIGLQLGDQSGYELSLRNENDLLQSYTTSNSVVTTNMTTAQDSLNSILTSAQSVQTNLTTWSSESSASTQTLANIGVNGLQDLIATTNTTSNGQYVFGGQNSGTPPLTDYSTAMTTVDQAFQTYFGFAPTDSQASSITASQMQTFLSGPFAALFDSTGWTTNFSSASSTNTSAEIAPGDTVDTSTNANEAGFQQLAQGYAMLAAFGDSQLSNSVQQVVASSATALVTQGVSSTTGTEATVGATLSRVTDATNAMSSQMTLLQTQIGNLDNVDATAVATQITSLSTQLQTAYTLTAQLQKLSLAQYI